MGITKGSVISSLVWKFMERIGAQTVQFLVQIILARLLLPEDFGIIVIVIIFINIASVFVQQGFSTALIQKTDTDNTDYSTVFYINLVVASSMYICLYIAAPYIAEVFRQDLLTQVLRVVSITLLLGAVISIQTSYLIKRMEFKKQFISTLLATVISGIVSVVMAYKGFGVWALVTQQMLSQVIIIFVLSFVVKWRPALIFSKSRAISLFSYGWKLLISSLIDVLYNNSRSIIIGKMYDASTLAYYNRGEQFPSLLVTNINGSIQSVIFPTLVAYKEDIQKVKSIVRRAVTLSSFFVFPIMTGLAATAEPIIKILLGNNWLLAVPFIRIACSYFIFWPIHTANLQAINAIGRSDIFLKLEILKKSLGIIVLICTIPFGIYAIALGLVLISLISIFINAWPSRKLFNYKYSEQFKDLFPSFIAAILMGGIVYSLNFFESDIFLILVSQIFVGIVMYILLAMIFRDPSYFYLKSIIYKKIKRDK